MPLLVTRPTLRSRRPGAASPPLIGLSALLLAAAGAVVSARSASARSVHTHEVRMIGDSGHARFEPAQLTVDAGDSVVFVVASGQPHNVAFDTTALSAPQKLALRSAVHDPMLPFAGPLLLREGDRYALSTAGLPAGTYPFFCMTHMALDMRGRLVVR